MDKTISKNVSGFTNHSMVPDQPAFVSNHWQPGWPDCTTAIAWPQTPPDFLIQQFLAPCGTRCAYSNGLTALIIKGVLFYYARQNSRPEH